MGNAFKEAFIFFMVISFLVGSMAFWAISSTVQYVSEHYSVVKH